MSVFVANESGVPFDADELGGLARFALGRLGVHPQAEVSILAVDTTAMTDLHVQWMGEPGPTDVLSFPMDELTEHGTHRAHDEGPDEALLGDIVLCPQVAVTQATEAGHPFAHELRVLTVHGLLHLLGYDHAEPDEEREMFSLQATLVGEWEAGPEQPGPGSERGAG